MRMPTSSWVSTMARLGFRLIEQIPRQTRGRNSHTAPPPPRADFLVEPLEPRQMLALALVPLPSPVHPNPCDPAIVGNSQYDWGGNPSTGGPGNLGSGGTSPAAVRYFDGMIAATSPLVQSDALDGAFGLATTWSAYSLLSSNDSGTGVSNPFVPLLRSTQNDEYLIINGAQISWFELSGSDYTQLFYGHDTLTHNPTTSEFTYTDSTGNILVFYDQSHPVLSLRIKSATSPGGIVTNFAYHTSGDLAGKLDSIDRSGTFNSLYAGERFLYSYNGDFRIDEISWDQRTSPSGSWTTRRTVAYSYYGSGESYGVSGSLKQTIVKDSADNAIDTTYYRYYTSGSNSQLLKYFFRPASYDRLAQDVADPLNASDATVAPYADSYFEYDGSKRVTKAVAQGEGCSSCSGGLGEFTYSYYERTSGWSPGMNEWKYRTIETLPDGSSQNVVYTNEFGEAMLNIFRESSSAPSTEWWKAYTRYDDDGRIIVQADPVAVTGFQESYDDLVNYGVSGNPISDTAGLIASHTYHTSGSAVGYFASTSVQEGENGTPSALLSVTYTLRSAGGVSVVYAQSETTYRGAAGGSPLTTSYAYTYHSGVVAPQAITITYDAVSTGQNGSGTSVTESLAYNEFGHLIWSRDGSGFVNYYAYDLGSRGLTQAIVDVSSYSGFPQAPSWTLTGNGLHLTSNYEVDFFGRTTRSTDPNGRVDYTVYRDPQHEVRSYGGWDSTSGTATLPTFVQRYDRQYGYLETIVMSAAPSVSGGRPDGTESIASIQNWSRWYANPGGQLTEIDDYFDLSGLTYSVSPSIGSEGTNFLRTRRAYDSRGRLRALQEPNGTIHRYVFDNLSRLETYWVGTDDTPTSGTWSPTNNDGANMQNTRILEYDDGGLGNGNLTELTVRLDDTTQYVTALRYDYRNRLVVERGPDGVASGYTYSNLDEVTQVDLYRDSDSDFTLDSGELRGRRVASFDDLGRVYQESVYEVDPSSGTAGDRLTTNYWYDPRGYGAKTASPNGLFSKTTIDGAGRAITQWLSIDGSESSYADALTASGDTVIEQMATIYDPGSRPVTTIALKRLESDSGSTGLLGYGSGYRDVSVFWYDRADRPTHATTYGRDDGSTRYVINTSNQLIDGDSDGLPDEAEGTPRAVNSSDDWITAQTQYDAAGRAYRSIDNLGRIQHTTFDALNRVYRVISNYVDGQNGETEFDTDQRVVYEYLPGGQLELVRNFNAKGSGNGVEHQATRALYESAVDRSWVTSVIYPDSSDTTSSGTDQVKYAYDALGRLTQKIDPRGVDHRYHYDSAGRFWKNRIVNNISGVDLTVKRYEVAFDDVGRVAALTNYDAGSGGNVVNQIAYTYNGWGLVSQTQQAHDGAAGGGTPAVTYTYADGAASGEAKYVRLTRVDYPAGEDVYYVYPASGIGNALNRVEAIADNSAGTTRFAEYTYLGAQTIVKIAHPQTTYGLNLSYGSAGTYNGWDRFGRIVEQKWTNTAGTALDHETYAYDRNSNLTSRTSVLRSALNETYALDGLDRLASLTRGGSAYQSWTLDGAGNWASFTHQGSTQTRTHNGANEVATISGQNAPAHDANGNLTQAPKPSGSGDQVYVYDGWNRLKQVKETGGAVIATYEYDARGRRIEKIVGSTSYDYFYNEASQIVEVRLNDDPDPLERYVWDVSYVDTPVVALRDTDTDGALNARMYYLWDASRNVTAVMFGGATGVAERLHYDAYGKVQFYTAAWSTKSGTSYGTVHTFTGREYDSESGLYYFRARYYDPSLGRFVGRDPIGYADGMNLYPGVLRPRRARSERVGRRVDVGAGRNDGLSPR